MLSFLLAQAADSEPKYLYFLLAWLIGAAMGGYLSERKGYGERLGLGFGILLSVVGTLIWLLWPPRPDSKWKTLGPWGRGKSTEERLESVDRATSGD